MYKKIRLVFVQSIIMLPLLSPTLTVNPVQGLPTALQGIVSLQDKTEIVSAADLAKTQQAAKIDAFYAERGMPLKGYGQVMVDAAVENGLDPYLLAAIAARESSGGIDMCNHVSNNPFGWASCKVGFKSMKDAIWAVGEHLGGNNEHTAHYYENKTTSEQILKMYNPDSIVPGYSKQVIAIMKAMDRQDISKDLATTEKTVTKS